MIIYLDSDYVCHTISDGAMREFETDVFDGKCKTFIEGYRLIPYGETWIRPDGVVFHGEMISPAVDYKILKKAQEQYELDQVSAEDMRQALEILGVTDE